MSTSKAQSNSSIRRLDSTSSPWLSVHYESGSGKSLLRENNVLAVLEFGRSPLDSLEARHVPVALEPLFSEQRKEVWRTRGPIESGRLDYVQFSRGLDLTMGHIALDVRASGGIRAASHLAYRQMEDFLARSGHHWPLKIWNYIPGINLGNGDSECYREFCVGRAEALAAAYDEQPPLPAATAIGVPASEPALQVYFMAGAMPGLHVENPRQVNAWRYPRQYGPRSPLFSRGTVVELGNKRHFLISGTASVIGHESRHVDDVRLQIQESMRNVSSLVAEGYRLLGKSREKTSHPSILKIYVRRPEDAELIRSTIAATLPSSVSSLFLQGDVCRSDLLTEVDGIALIEHP